MAPIADAERDDAAEEQAFVGDRIEDDAEGAALVITPRDIAIESVADRRDEEDEDRGEALPFQRFARVRCSAP